MNKDAESWAKVKPESVCSGSNAQAVNVLTMALEDIQALAREIAELRRLSATPKRNPYFSQRKRFPPEA